MPLLLIDSPSLSGRFDILMANTLGMLKIDQLGDDQHLSGNADQGGMRNPFITGPMHKVPFPLSCGWPRFMTCQDLGVCKKTAKHDRNSHSMMRSDQYGPITYVALENPFMAQTAAIEAERHINAYATLRIRLPPWVFDVEAHARPWVKDTRLGEPVVRQLADPLPGRPILLAASPERPPPQIGDMVTERRQCPRICRHRVVRKEPGHNLPQPFPDLWDRLVHTPSQFLLDLLELRLHAVGAGLPFD